MVKLLPEFLSHQPLELIKTEPSVLLNGPGPNSGPSREGLGRTGGIRGLTWFSFFFFLTVSDVDCKNLPSTPFSGARAGCKLACSKGEDGNSDQVASGFLESCVKKDSEVASNFSRRECCDH